MSRILVVGHACLDAIARALEARGTSIKTLFRDDIHFNAEGQIKLGKITASAVKEFYKAKQ